jgi:hypothetical protein
MSVPAPHFLHRLPQALLSYLAGWIGIPSAYLRLATVWVLAVVFGYFVRWFLIEFVGDVAIYTTGYKVSVFDEVRSKIRQTIIDDAAPIYAARTGDPTNGPFVYDHVIIVGHSLGSVIAYDTLNSLIADDVVRSSGLNVAGRTRFLLTFGSPLDKIAFVFRTHSSRTHDFREKAAEEIQPLIREYAYRPERWVNIWSPMDIISGRLRYYDDKDPSEGGSQRVVNVWDKEAWVLFAAHTEYWEDALFAQLLYDAILSIP